MLSFDGPRANVLREELCRRLCERNDGNLDPVVVHNTGGGHSSELSNLYSDMEHIKQDQLANGEVIRSLSDLSCTLPLLFRNFETTLEIIKQALVRELRQGRLTTMRKVKMEIKLLLKTLLKLMIMTLLCQIN